MTATDPDGDPIAFDLSDSPGGMIFDEVSGQLLWAPTADQIGSNSVTITVSDGRGGSASQSFLVDVSSARDNSPPVIFSQAPATLEASQIYSYVPSSIDPDGDSIRYRLLAGPEGARVDPVSGQVTWDPRGRALLLNERYSDRGYIKTPMSPSITSSTSLTVEGDFRLDRTDINQSFFRKSSFAPYPASVNTFSLRFMYGQLRGTIGGPDSTGAMGDTFVAQNWTPEPGLWYHLALTFDDATGILSVYVDGHLFGQAATGRHLVYDNQDMLIGDDYTDPLFGQVADFRMWDYAKTQEQLRTDFLSSPADDAPGLVLDYRFADGDAQTLRDHSQNANNGRRSSGGSRWPVPSLGLSPVQTQTFIMQAEDGRGAVSQQSFQVTVAPTQRHSISGTVFSDDDANGDQGASESALAGSIVYVDANNNGVHDGNETFATTDSQGRYLIPGQLAGSYRLAVEERAGLLSVPVQLVELDAFANAAVDFGLTHRSGSSIRGSVLIDANANGTVGEAQPVYSSNFDSPPPNLSLWSKQTIVTTPSGDTLLGKFTKEPVTLSVGGPGNPLPAHAALTLSFDLILFDGWYGNYNYASTHPTQWALEAEGIELLRSTFSSFDGYPQAYPQATGASNPARSGAARTNTFGSGVDTTYHLTFTIPHNLASAKFTFRGIDVEYNANNASWALDNVTVTAAEPAAAHWSVYLDANGNEQRDADERAVLTDARGDYAFTGLPAGDWHVRLDNEAGWTTTAPGTAQYAIALSADSTSSNNDFVVVGSSEAASRPRFLHFWACSPPCQSHSPPSRAVQAQRRG